MSRKYRTWREAEVEHFRSHPEEVQPYLDVALEEAEDDGDWRAFLAAVRTVVEASGGMAELAERLGCSRTTLYRTLSSEGNPRLGTLGRILHALGYRLSVRARGADAQSA